MAIALCGLGVPSMAHADLRLHLSAIGAMPYGGWQAAAFGPGAGASAALELSLGSRFGWVNSLNYAVLSTSDGALAPGVARPGLGSYGDLLTGVRIRPFGRSGRHGEGLWLDAQAGGALTGTTLRPVLSGRLGYGLSLGGVSVGPWAGIDVVFQTDSQAIPDDARIVMVGMEISIPLTHPPPLPPPIRPPPPPPPPVQHQCPPPAAHTVPDRDGDGCPENDTDGDGIPDTVDRCPNEPEDFDGFEDTDGCPDPDNDRDGIPDTVDRCPNEPEVINGVDDTDGCPDTASVHVDAGRLVLDDRLQFAFDSDQVDPSGAPVIRAIARLMAAHPEYTRLSVEGHADDRGSDEYNFDLSYHRARAVADLLVAAGVPRRRIFMAGYGRLVPRVPGTDDAAMAVNRRVEFFVDGHRSHGVVRIAPGYARINPDGSFQRIPGP